MPVNRNDEPFNDQLLSERVRRIARSPWFDCAREVQAEARDIAQRFGQSGMTRFMELVVEQGVASANTLRRYLGVLEFVERRALLAGPLPPEEVLSFVRSNFSGLEKISRLEKIAPDTVETWLTNLAYGRVTTRQLEDELTNARLKNPTSTTARRGLAVSDRKREIKALEEPLVRHLAQSIGPGKLLVARGPSFLRMDWMYLSGATPINETTLQTAKGIGIQSSGASTQKGHEDALIQADFTSRFFDRYLLVINHTSGESVGRLLKMLEVCSPSVKLLVPRGAGFDEHPGRLTRGYELRGPIALTVDILTQQKKDRK